MGQEISALKKDKILLEKELENQKNEFAEYLKNSLKKEELASDLQDLPVQEEQPKKEKISFFEKLMKIL